MKILGQHVAAMYIVTIILVAAIDIVAAYTNQVFPLALVLAVVFSVVIAIAARLLIKKQRPKIPFSAIITGLIIGSVAPANAPVLLILLASAIAVLSKYLIRIKGSNIFNPAALGLLVALAVFSVGDVWWLASSYNIYGIGLSLTLLLIIAAYSGRRLHLAVSFVVTLFVISYVVGFAGGGLSVVGIIVTLAGINYFFAFLMLVDPKTSPIKGIEQTVYGIGMAILYFGLAVFNIGYPLLVSLLLGNIAYAIYRNRAHLFKIGKI